jgi:pimeloyl-ACP methyl ester carboxylesterase
MNHGEDNTMIARRMFFVWSAILLIGVVFEAALVSAAGGSPTVVRTNPANGATGVSRSLTSVSFTFSEPMDSRSCGCFSSNWGPSSCTWSAGNTVLTLTRNNDDALLGLNSTVIIRLNDGFDIYHDVDGNPLSTFTLSFTTAGAEIEEVKANPGKGFSWPYFLYVPPTVSNPPVLLVEPNNTGTTSNDQNVHLQAARNLINWRSSFAEDLQLPLLVPVFPRPAAENWQIYTHALDRDCLMTEVAGLERIDLQLIAMIDDARDRLADMDILIDDKIFLNGFSASGSFVNRFALLHPELVKAVASGSPGGWPTVPKDSWEGKKLIYPAGTADLKALTGKSFNLKAYRSVPAFIYIGDSDSNDAVPYGDGFSDNERQLIYNLFGAPPDYPYVRWPKAEGIFRLAKTNTQLYIYPDVGHAYSNEMWEDLKTFFSHYQQTNKPLVLKKKPLRYTIYFPHVAAVNQWQTEIGITNNIQGLEIQGRLQGYDSSGNAAGSAVDITLESLARKEFNVASDFKNADEISYISLTADSFYISGYTKFSKRGNRVAIAATTGKPRGIFLKKDNQGWTGIAYVNPENRPIHVTMKAMNDRGDIIASKSMSVAAGAKVIGTAEGLFDVDISNATYISYYADGNIIGFSLNGSDDGKMLDGLPAAPEMMN